MSTVPACFQELLHALKLADAKDSLSEESRVHSAYGMIHLSPTYPPSATLLADLDAEGFKSIGIGASFDLDPSF